jgi:hypothetical protein
MSYKAKNLPEVVRSSEEEIFHLMFEAEPAPDNTDDTDVAGGYINFWMDTEDLDSAEAVALECLEAEKWVPVKLLEHNLLPRTNWIPEYTDEEAEMWSGAEEQFDEYGLFYLFYCWGHNDPDNAPAPE